MPNYKIKAVIFDYGNVIAKFDNNIFLEKVSEFTNKTVSELNEMIFVSSDLPKKYETGLITSDEFFSGIVKICDLSISKMEFVGAYTNKFAPIKTTIDLIKKLKNRYKIALLSNTNEWDFEYEIKKNEIFSLFDAVSLSFKVKAKKPDSKIYMNCLNKLDLKPEECVYIDDKEKHIKGANRLRINNIHYISHEKLIDSLKKLKVDCD